MTEMQIQFLGALMTLFVVGHLIFMGMIHSKISRYVESEEEWMHRN